jgi:hypothetical protein
MVRQILPNNNEKCYSNFFPKIYTSKHALSAQTSAYEAPFTCVEKQTEILF